MKLIALNDLCDEIVKLANFHDETKKMWAVMYADNNDKAAQENFRIFGAKSDAIREAHKLVCQHLHYVESLLTKDEIARFNLIEEQKKNSK